MSLATLLVIESVWYMLKVLAFDFSASFSDSISTRVHRPYHGFGQHLLSLEEKYVIPSLTSRCILFLRDHLDSGNIFCVLKHSNLIENKSLCCSCWKFIDKETKDVLASTEFLQVDRTDLIELVQWETLNIQEIDLSIAVNKWAENQSKELRLGASTTVKTRQILGEEIIKNLCFPLMEQKDFCNVVCKTDVLIEEEIREVESHFQDQRSPVRFLAKRKAIRSYNRNTATSLSQRTDLGCL